MNYRFEDLEILVKSLTGAEKRYFIYYCKAFLQEEEDPFYLQVFSVLVNDSFELPEVSSEMSKQAMTSAKRKIFDKLSNAMLIYHQKRSVEMVIRNLLGKVEIFYHQHNLPDQANFILQKALTLARANEVFGLLLETLTWERKLCMMLTAPTRPVSEIINEEHSLSEQLMQIRKLENIYFRAKEFKKAYGYVKGEQKAILESETIASPEMPDAADCLSKKAVFYYNFIYTLYYWMVVDPVNAYRYSKKMLKHEIQVIIPNDYVDGILEHVTSSVCVGYFEEALNGLKVADVYIEDQKLNMSHAFVVKMFYYQISYHLILYNYMGNRKRLEETIREAEEKLEHYKHDLSVEATQVITANLLNAYVGVGDMVKADKVWDSLFRKRSKSVRRDIYDSLYLFRLFSLFQSETYVLIPVHASTAYRYYLKFKDHETQFDLELRIARLLKNSYTLADPSIRSSKLLRLERMISDHISELNGINGFQEQYTFYLVWIKSLLTGKEFTKCAHSWYLNYKASLHFATGKQIPE